MPNPDVHAKQHFLITRNHFKEGQISGIWHKNANLANLMPTHGVVTRKSVLHNTQVRFSAQAFSGDRQVRTWMFPSRGRQKTARRV